MIRHHLPPKSGGESLKLRNSDDFISENNRQKSTVIIGVFRVTPWEYSKSGSFRFLTVEYSATLNTPLSNIPDFYGIFRNSLISPSPNSC